jgi:hypothetical protein
LQSLKKADFFSSTPPRLTIELPHDIDTPSKRFIEHFQWPPEVAQNTGSLLTLHHRIPQHGLTPEENSIRLLESFWPADPVTSHVLILSPQMELSPLFYHYLKYTLLEYKYSSSKALINSKLLGISLESPEKLLDASSKFTPPLVNATVGKNVISKGVGPFLWQAPNSNAALYFGDKWVELHDFVSHLLSSQHALPSPSTLNEKLVSKKYPSWLEHILKLSRARGYSTIYPNFENADSLATRHEDLYQPPEEFAEEIQAEAPDSDELTADPSHHVKNSQASLLTTSLLNILPFNGELPKILDMPLVAWDGEPLEVTDMAPLAINYSKIFRREIGGCDEEMPAKIFKPMQAGDLFCLDDPGV